MVLSLIQLVESAQPTPPLAEHIDIPRHLDPETRSNYEEPVFGAESSGDSDDEVPLNAKRNTGQWSKEDLELCLHEGRKILRTVNSLAVKLNRSPRAVYQKMAIEVPYGRKSNISNIHKQLYALKEPQEDGGMYQSNSEKKLY